MTAIALTRTLHGLAAADDHARRYLSRIPPGSPVDAEMTQPRTEAGRNLFRRYWKLMEIVAENTEQYGGSRECASDHIKVLAGHCDMLVSKATGEVFLRPKSISWADCEEPAFALFWDRAVLAICEHVIPGLTVPELEDEILRCLGASTWTSPEPSPSSPNAGPAVDGRAHTRRTA